MVPYFEHEIGQVTNLLYRIEIAEGGVEFRVEVVAHVCSATHGHLVMMTIMQIHLHKRIRQTVRVLRCQIGAMFDSDREFPDTG